MPDYNHDPIIPRVGTAANLATATMIANEMLWTTDTFKLYVEQGGVAKEVGAGSFLPLSGGIISGDITLATADLNIHQGYIELSDPDVAHGMTTIAPTNVYGKIHLYSGTSGGLWIKGLSDDSNNPMKIDGYLGTSTPNADAPALEFSGGKKNGNTWQALAADETVFVIANYSTIVDIILGSGTHLIPVGGLHVGGTTDPGDNNLLIDGTATFTGVTTLCNGLNYIGDTSNAKMTVGLTINQGANDDEIFCLKSSDVSHAMTDFAEADTYGTLSKLNTSGLYGILQVTGYSESTMALYLVGRATGENTDTATTALSPALAMSCISSGTGVAATVASANIFCVRNFGDTKFIVKGDGDIYYDGADQGAYDAFDDALACQDLSYNLSNQLGKVLKYNKEKLHKMGVIAHTIHDSGKEDIFISRKGMDMLQLGAIGELYRVCNKLCDKMKITFKEAKCL
jgi:hypothetical protein